MIKWPETLVREIVKERCVFFLGAGVSASADDGHGNRPPTWQHFLDKACALVADSKARRAVKLLIKEGKLLIALQAIREHSDPSDYRHFLDQHFNNQNFKPNALHQIIFDLDARIVITTNFDKIYERYCTSYVGGPTAFKVIDYGASDLADEIRSDTRLIIKAHGSIDRISDMIFTRSQYHEAKRKHPHFYEVLKGIFLTNTIVFIGCGLEDPDMMLLLEDVQITGRHEKPHYALTLKGSKNKFLISDWKTTYNIRVLEFGPDYSALTHELQNLLDHVNAVRAAMFSGLS